MKRKKLKKFSTINLALGYLMAFVFLFLVFSNRKAAEMEQVKVVNREVVKETILELNETKEAVTLEGKVYLPGNSVFNDRVSRIELKRDLVAPTIDSGLLYDTLPVIDIVGHRDVYLGENDRTGTAESGGGEIGHGGFGHVRGDRIRSKDIRVDRARENDEVIVDRGLLDRRIADLDRALAKKKEEEKLTNEEKYGLDGENFAGLTVVRDGDDFELGELGDLRDTKIEGIGEDGFGFDKGGLYAYDFPSQGVGAGVGSSAVGAGAGGGAGLSAGIGEAVLDGKAVPTLGGVGGSMASPTMSGVGGLVGGAGAGGAAGLATGMVKPQLGVPGVAPGVGIGVGNGGYGKHEYDLPPDGALHIMMHVDGSGSILNTRKQLEVMKDTLLKDALLPYYNNDETLYNRRVTIVDGNGERTLQFFTQATQKDNVLALVFQDEAQPAYHLPTFNKKPQENYAKDLQKLKGGLNGYGGLYRGIMFQVDRGRTFAKSFKEFVESAWQGTGYLEDSNLKKYYWQENKQHIENKNGIVFSDEYHAKDSGDPQYYLDLIMRASLKIGLNLRASGGGLVDGAEER